MSLIVASIAVRWLFCFVVFPQFLAERSTVGTEYYFDSYREIAASVLQGCGYRLSCDGPPALHRPPGYVAFMLLTDPADPAESHVFVHLLNGIVGGLAVWLTFLAARAWRLSERAALFAAAVVAFWPFLIWETKVTVPENLLIALIPAIFAMIPAARRSFGFAAAVGALAGATALTHASYQVVVLAVLPALFWPRDSARVAPPPDARAGSFRRTLVHAAVVLIVFTAVVTPWVARNRAAGYGGIASGFGYHYWKGVYDFELLTDGGAYFRDNDIAATAFVNRTLRARGLGGIDTNAERSDPGINRFLDRSAVRHMFDHPIYTFVKTIAKIPLAWVQQQNAKRAAFTAVLLLPLFALAFRSILRRRHLLAIAAAVLFLNAAFASVFIEAMPMRYVLPLLPLLAILAAGGIEREPSRESLLH